MAEEMNQGLSGESPKTQYPSITDMVNMAENNLANSHIKAHDPYRAAKVTPYPAQALGFPEYYTRSAYKRLGFNPFENNRQIYSENTTSWEKIKDTGSAFWSMTKDNLNIFGSGREQDAYAATRYERQAELSAPIGDNSTFGWLLKQAGQAGYTASLITSIAAEELALLGATALSEGTLGGVAWARTVENFNRLARLTDKVGDAKKAKQIYDATDFMKDSKSAVNAMKDLNDASKARAFWNSIPENARKFMGKASEKIAPHATEYVRALQQADSKLNKLNGFAKMTHGFGAFYREMREINLAFQESGLEKAFVEKDAMQRLVAAYKAEHGGKEPTGSELSRLQDMAKQSGASTFAMNSGLIYLTNKVGFGMLFNKFGPRLATEQIQKSKFGKFYINRANLKKGMTATTEFVKKGIIPQAKHAFKKSTLKRAPMRTLRYMSGAFATGASEGVQEYFQEVIQDAESQRALDHYTKGARGSFLDTYGTSMKKFMSAQGAEVFMSGFVMGGFATPYRMAVEQVSGGAAAGIDYISGNYRANKNHKQDTQRQYEERVKYYNEMFKSAWSKEVGLGGLSKYTDYLNLQSRQDEALEQEDEKAYRDIKDDATLEVIYNAIDGGVFDTLMDQMEQVEGLSDQEIAETFRDELGENPSPEQIDAFRKDSRQIVDRARQVEALKRDVDNRFRNPYSYATNDDDEDTGFGPTERRMHQLYESAKRSIVRNQYSYQRSLERMDNIMNDVSTKPPFWSKKKVGPASDITVLFNPSDLTIEIDLLSRELKGMKDMTGLDKSQLKDKKEKTQQLERLTEMAALLGALQKEYKEESDSVKAGIGTEGAQVKLNTRAGGTATIIGESSKKYKVKNNKTGRSYWVNKDNVTVTKADTEKSDTVARELNKSFKKYMKFLADKNDNTVKEEDLDKAFTQLLDFYALDQDAKNLTKTLNQLMNPKGFEAQVQRQARLDELDWTKRRSTLEEDYKRQQQDIEDELEASIQARQNQEFVNTLAKEHNAFITEDDLQAIFETADQHSDVISVMTNDEQLNYIVREVLPEDMFDVNNLKPIRSGTERYTNIVKEFQEYLTKRWQKEEVAEEAPVQDTTAPVEEVATPVTPTATREPVTFETPYSQWPEELQAAAQEAQAQVIEGISENMNMTDAVRQKMIEDLTDIENFIQSPTGQARLNATLNDYNNNLVAKDQVEEVLGEPIIEEEEAVDTPIATTQAEQDIEAGIVEPDIAPVDYYTAEELEVIQEAGIEDVEEIDEVIPEITLDLDPTTMESIMEGNTTTFIVGLGRAEIQPMVDPLQAAGQIRNNRLSDKNQTVLKLQTKIADDDYIILYRSKSSAEEIAKIHPNNELTVIERVASILDLPTKPTATHAVPVKMTDDTNVYVRNESEKLWLEGQGKQHIFRIAKFTPQVELSAEAEASAYESLEGGFAWESNIIERLNNVTSPEDLNLEYSKIVQEDLQRELDGLAFFGSEQLQVYYNEALEALPTAEGKTYNVGENYRMKGKLSNFGVAMVDKITNEGVRFKSHASGEVSEFIPTEELPAVVKSQVMDLEKEIQDQKAEMTPSEEKIAEENKKSTEEFSTDAASIKDILDEADKMDDESADSNFFDNLGCE